MRIPLLFIPTALIFWGYQAKLLWVSLIMAIVILGISLFRRKYDFAPEDFNKFVDVCIIFIAATIVLGFTIEARTAIWFLLKWLPLCTFPVMAAQQFSKDGKIYMQSFLFTSRRKVSKAFPAATELEKIDISYPYVFVCVFCAGMIPGGQTGQTPAGFELYFFICSVLAVWALWQVRSKRYPVVLWGLLIGSMIGVGFFGQKALRTAGYQFRDWVISRYAHMYVDNPFKSYTAMGDIGQLKLSGKIIMRVVQEDAGQREIFRLQKAVYDRFAREIWISRAPFQTLKHQGEDGIRQVNPMSEPVRRMRIYARPVQGRAVLSLPAGTMRISNLRTGICSKNQLQTLRIEDAPPLIAAKVEYTGYPQFDAPPSKDDLFVPEKEVLTVRKMNGVLELDLLDDFKKAERIREFFLKHFNYSLDLAGKGDHDTPLQNFLLFTRKGHCEFFATATVLMMRQAGIPARYVTGYLVSEYSVLEGKYLVRNRDAHAWARIYVNGQWLDWDTTPPGFVQFDNEFVETSLFFDLLSYLSFHLLNIRYETGKDLLEAYGLWLALPLGLMLWLRLRQTSRIKRANTKNQTGRGNGKDRLGESFYLLEDHLRAKERGRYPHETYRIWLDRIRDDTFDDKLMAELNILLHLHNRMVFGRGISHEEKAYLFKQVREIIQRPWPDLTKTK